MIPEYQGISYFVLVGFRQHNRSASPTDIRGDLLIIDYSIGALMTGLSLFKKELSVMWKKILSIAGALLVLGAVFTGGWILDDRYATADNVKQNKNYAEQNSKRNKIDIQINQHKNDIRWYQDQMSYIMTRCGVRDPNALPQHAHKNYMDYKFKKETLNRELNIIMQKRNKF